MNDDKNTGAPLDPSNDFEDIINDKSGLTGITTNTNPKKPIDDDVTKVNESSHFRVGKNEEMGGIADGNDNQSSSELPKMGSTLQQSNVPHHVEGEEKSINGDMPEPSADDDVLANAHEMGIALEEDEEHPQELDLGGDIDKAEEHLRNN